MQTNRYNKRMRQGRYKRCTLSAAADAGRYALNRKWDDSSNN